MRIDFTSIRVDEYAIVDRSNRITAHIASVATHCLTDGDELLLVVGTAGDPLPNSPESFNVLFVLLLLLLLRGMFRKVCHTKLSVDWLLEKCKHCFTVIDGGSIEIHRDQVHHEHNARVVSVVVVVVVVQTAGLSCRLAAQVSATTVAARACAAQVVPPVVQTMAQDACVNLVLMMIGAQVAFQDGTAVALAAAVANAAGADHEDVAVAHVDVVAPVVVGVVDAIVVDVVIVGVEWRLTVDARATDHQVGS
jgi:hypothetical protein